MPLGILLLGLLMSLKHLTPDDLHPLLNDPSVLLIDIRNDHELVSGILPGALHLPLGNLATAFSQLPQDKKLVFYCRSGVRSVSAGEFALAQGCADVSHLAGGILAWAGAGLPIEPA
jgi:rhodanese-related sulfurtransferase